MKFDGRKPVLAFGLELACQLVANETLAALPLNVLLAHILHDLGQ